MTNEELNMIAYFKELTINGVNYYCKDYLYKSEIRTDAGDLVAVYDHKSNVWEVF